MSNALLIYCHGTQAMDNSRICHHLLFHERGKQYFVHAAISSVNEATEATHTAFTKLHTEVTS